MKSWQTEGYRQTMRIIGLMSGTSADGIDAALVEIAGGPRRFRWALRAFVCVPWEAGERAAILEACRSDAPIQTIVALNYRLGEAFAAAAEAAAQAAGVPMKQVDAIASHGQTVWHQPTPFDIAGTGAIGTLQIGEPAVIAARTGCVVVADFRAADMALGGQGAPLVPFADYALFASKRETRVVQNLGGIANVTFLPAGGTLADVRAFDTGPGNMLLDALTRRVTNGAQSYDANGDLAARGTVCLPLLAEFLAHPYFAVPPPKSTGREMFGEAFAERFYRAARRRKCAAEDTLATATALTAETISRAYHDWLLPHGPIQTVILGGGGVHNRTLVRLLSERLAPARLTTHAAFGLPDDAKEAVAFALLAYETLHGRPSNVPSATGARGPAVLGKIVLPPPCPSPQEQGEGRR
ncbi:MAG TPA: anhydro-N-acetylmuramic acid kinase [Chthonomonadaceae bacterium]|nr:anhydro-N-acetylmuramic acid kinase [Chthonomonadaceae bacterium]